ncbi:MAG TPA: hypothetical protein VKS60_08060 [Stellaceae bacterium]|nr:hypothetical protein [Stellaceae bacterium]
MKRAIIRQIGVSGLELPAQVAAALAANDRAKSRLSLLQYARAHAEHPEAPTPDLRAELDASGLTGVAVEQIVGGAHKVAAGYRIPGSPTLLAGLAEDVGAMALPLGTGFAARSTPQIELLSAPREDVLTGAFIDQLTQADGSHPDQLHQLIMDMHKALNRLQAELAEEEIGGVATYQVAPTDRVLIQAFARGLNRTARLKFGHPGLATTATRAGSRLLLQNDIGTTDAHVLVVQVEGLAVRITYSDVHAERLAFFQSLFAGRGVEWSGATEGRLETGDGDEAYELSVGTFAAADEPALSDFLERLGSRLVFLIDWNKARKQLRDFLKPAQRLQLLSWAAENDIGHRGFLEMGGARLVNDAIEAIALGVVHFGERLDVVLGGDATYRFLQFTFRVATDAMLADQSPALVRDRVRAELAVQLNASGYRLSQATAEHAAITFELATAVQDALLGLVAGEPAPALLATRAKAWEHRADEFVVETRQLVRRRRDHEPFCRVIEAADDAADALEEAAFLVGLLGPAGRPPRSLAALESLAATVTEACQEWVKAVGHVNHVQGLGSRDDASDFLTAVDRIGAFEHATDDGERQVTATALDEVEDFRQLHLVTAVGNRLEATVDALRQASLILRDQVLSDVLA